MAKIHTRMKRKQGIRSTSFRHKFMFKNIVPKKGPKSFSSSEKAEEWAKEHEVDRAKFHLYEVRSDKWQWRPMR